MSAMVDKQQLCHHFSLHAHDYDLVTAVQAEMGDELLARVRRSADTARFRQILELGCGTGRLTAALRRDFPEAHLTAVDFSADMLALARQRLGHDSRVEWVHGDAESLALGAFPPPELVIANAMIQWLSDPPTALRHFAALAKANALFAFSGFAAGTFGELRDAFAQAESDLGREPVQRVMPMLAADEWLQLARQVWPRAELHVDPVVVCYPSLRDFVRTIKLTGASMAGRSPRSIIDRPLYQRLREIYDERHGDPATGAVRATWCRFHLLARNSA